MPSVEVLLSNRRGRAVGSEMLFALTHTVRKVKMQTNFNAAE